MIYSMTGYGAVKSESSTHNINVEIKTLNSKYLDLQIRLPKEYADRETEARIIISDLLKRGKVNVSIEINTQSEPTSKYTIDKDMFIFHYNSLKDLCETVGAPTDQIIQNILLIPEVISTTQAATENDLWPEISNLLKAAASDCNKFRIQEGSAIATNLEKYILNIKNSLKSIENLDPQRIVKVKERIRNNVLEIAGKDNIDENRFEQELIYYVEKIDISEEKVRLSNHLDYFLSILNLEESQGKKLGFVSQEIGREINTIGSKANDAEIQKEVVEMKEELEKIKEQLLNIM